jgi:hypothetical protein
MCAGLKMTSPRSLATKPLFYARHYYWLARNIPKACLAAGCSLEQTQRVMDIMVGRLEETSDAFDQRKFRREVTRVIWEVKHGSESIQP